MDYPVRTLQQIRPLLVGFRKQAGLSQAEVAALLGVTQQSYAKIEANPASTSVDRLFTILRLFGSEIVLSQRSEQSAVVPSTTPNWASESGSSTSSRKQNVGGVVAPPKVNAPSKKLEHW